jgi:hypothetical protein
LTLLIYPHYALHRLSLIKKAIEKKTGKSQNWIKELALVLSIAVLPIACIASVGLEIGANDPAPWFKPTQANIVGNGYFHQTRKEVSPIGQVWKFQTMNSYSTKMVLFMCTIFRIFGWK